MELNSAVFYAARDGLLCILRELLDHKTKEEVTMLVSLLTNNATPLIIACRNGHLDVALYLIENCHADVEQVGSLTYEDEVIYDAPPLWYAAVDGHIDLVKVLVKHKASVNSVTKSNSTAIRAACFDGHFEIVKYLIQHGADIEIANSKGHTCLMLACHNGHYEVAKYLVECGANVNRKSLKGDTALHDCAESGNLDILKFLLENGAKCDSNYFGITPLLSAAINGYGDVVDYFILEFDYTKIEKVNALELLGAAFMDEKRDMIKALYCWRKAIKLRYESTESPLEKPTECSPLASYIGTTEVRTVLELEDLILDPDEIRMQALLVRERILGPDHPETLNYISLRSDFYADNGNFVRCIQLWMYQLDVQQKVQEPLSSNTQSILLAFIEVFSNMMSEAWSSARRLPAVELRDILQVFQRVLKEIEASLALSMSQQLDLNQIGRFHCTLIISIHFIALMCKLQPHIDKSSELELKQSVYQLVKMNPRTQTGWTLLHLACLKDSSNVVQYPVCTFPSFEVVNLLLEVGACPNALDVGNNTPLHITAMNKPCESAIFKLLLNHGSHLDIRNLENQTPLQLTKQSAVLDIYPLQHTNLQCLCAQVVQSCKIPFQGFLQKRLEDFVNVH